MSKDDFNKELLQELKKELNPIPTWVSKIAAPVMGALLVAMVLGLFNMSNKLIRIEVQLDNLQKIMADRFTGSQGKSLKDYMDMHVTLYNDRSDDVDTAIENIEKRLLNLEHK